MTLIALAGLVLDGGEVASQYRTSQNAADAAALAAAYQITIGHQESAATTQANLAAQQVGVATSDLTLQYLDSSGHSTSTSGSVSTVTATIRHSFPTLFLPIMGIDSASIAASATVSLNGVSCVVCVMNPSASGALAISGNNTKLSLSGGVVAAASTSSSAITVGNNGNQLNGGQGVYVVGGVSAPAGAVTPTPTKVTSVADPLSSVPVPSVSGVQTCSSSPCNPGIYSSLSFSGGTWTLNPGTYVVAGGSFSVSGGATVTGSGVTIYLACSAYPTNCTPGQAGATASLSGNSSSSITLSAPTSGTYSGIAIFSDRNNTGSITVGGQGTLNLTGTIYAMSGPMTLGGGASGSTFNARVITDTLAVQGGSSFSLSYPTTGNIVVPSKLALSA